MDTPKKATKQQKDALVDFMEINYIFLFGKYSNNHGSASKEKKWQELTKQLNSLTGPNKTAELWKRTWTDLKRNTKKSLAKIRQSRNQTGSEPIDEELSQLESKIIAICGKQLLDGDKDNDEIGLYQNTKQCNDHISTIHLRLCFIFIAQITFFS